MANYIQVAAPEGFNFGKPNEWPIWFKRFQRYRIASELSEKSENEQVNALIYIMGDKAEEILILFNLSEAQIDDYKLVASKFQDYFIGKRNVIYERAKFNRRSQGETEPVEEFITNLYVLAETCSYDRNVDVIDRKGSRNGTNVRKTRMKGTKTYNSNFPKNPQGCSSYEKRKCFRCGYYQGHSKEQCPAKDAICNKCRKKGHFAKVRQPNSIIHIQWRQFSYSFCSIIVVFLPYLALLAYRATPLANGFSPAELSMGRRVRTTIPTPTKQHQPPNLKNLKNQETIQRGKQKYYYDRAKGVRELPPLDVNDRVWLTDLKTPGVIISKADTPRSYVVDTPRGSVRRNRFHLLPTGQRSQGPPHFEPDEEPYINCPEANTHTSDAPTDVTGSSTSPKEALYRTRSGRTVRPPRRFGDD
ncbi:hypothetical protein LAZ67_5002299 [Cordylochernes scorpioides]|uniref:CCHC-type domain-containing protein n=1 Tax=Cordylochernes scorpioides TaxID=51811 RepID=A0ABY6KGJ4_9ARAC|nr:hypothetical protein LAZ67_5002299 [Cordylochernes scorpioides]